MDRTAGWRDRAVAMLTQGHSAAEVWEALTSEGMDRRAAEDLIRELVELRRQAQAAPAPNIYAPPAHHAAIDYSPGWARDEGAIWKGLLAGFFCGCWALIFSTRMGSETRKGAFIGFAIHLFLNVIIQMARHH